MNQSPHSLDVLIWLGGKPTSVLATTITRSHRIEVEDSAEALLGYEDGHTGYLYTTTADWPGEDRLELTGDRGKLVVQDRTVRLYRLDSTLQSSIDTGAMWGKPSGAWESVELESTETGHQVVVRQFARSIRTGEPLIATGHDGLASLELANAIMLSGHTRERVQLPLDRSAYEEFLRAKRAR
jgi:predicted dehydrogenase